MVRGDWPREQFPRQWHDRFHADAASDDTRYPELQDARRQPPLAIEKALREHCGIPARHYFVAAILDDGSEQTFSGPGPHNPSVVRQIFNWNGFYREIRRTETGLSSMEDTESQFGGDAYRQPYGSNYSSGERTRRTSEIFNEEEPGFRPRKRNRYRRPNEEDEVPAVATGDKTGLKIGDPDAVWKLYDQRFRNCQQTACKLIAKAWVKVVEPKKQTNHPYTGKDEKAPAWWPKPWGATKEEKVRHKEPDHLYKRERVHLLCHILRMVVEPPEKQHPSIAKLCLNVTKLREATDEALSSFFFGTEDDKLSQKNSQKKPYLDEIFKIARLEERYRNGEIDADTTAWVMSEKSPEATQYQTDDGGGAKDEVDQPSGPSSASPPRTAMAHDGLMRASGSEHSPTSQSHLQGTGFLADMGGRGGTQYSAAAAAAAAQMIPHGLSADHQFIDDCGMKVSSTLMHNMVPNPQDGHRRSSMYASPTDYSNPPSAGLYNQTWAAGSTAPGNAAMYSFPPHAQAPSAQGHFGQPAVQMGQGQYMHGGYDATLQRGAFDQSTIYRSTAAANQAAYSGYLTPDGRALANPPVKSDALPRGPME